MREEQNRHEEIKELFERSVNLFYKKQKEYYRLTKGVDYNDESFEDMDEFYQYIESDDCHENISESKDWEYSLLSPLLDKKAETNKVHSFEDFTSTEEASSYLEDLREVIDFYDKEISRWGEVYKERKGAVKGNN